MDFEHEEQPDDDDDEEEDDDWEQMFVASAVDIVRGKGIGGTAVGGASIAMAMANAEKVEGEKQNQTQMPTTEKTLGGESMESGVARNASGKNVGHDPLQEQDPWRSSLRTAALRPPASWEKEASVSMSDDFNEAWKKLMQKQNINTDASSEGGQSKATGANSAASEGGQVLTAMNTSFFG